MPLMMVLAFALAAIALRPAQGVASLSSHAATSAQQSAHFVPVTDEVLRSPKPADWLAWRRDRGATGYSPLDQIQRRNVRGLRLAWAWAMEPGSLEPEPLVYNGVMYLPHPNDVVQALDARTGGLIWEYRRERPKDARGGGGVGGLQRNLALYQDKVLMATSDAHLVALDARNGRPVWDVAVVDSGLGMAYTSGPIVGDGRVFAGLQCGGNERAQCFVSAHDINTGKELWRRTSVAGPGDPPEHNATWNGLPFERRIKASLWLPGSYDSDLKLLYWTTGSAFPYTEIAKGTGNGTLLYTQSILSLKADTGAIAWFFQMVPRDNFDLDHADNPILADLAIRGVRRKVVYTMGKPSVLWAFDRQTGEHLWHRLVVPYQNIYKQIDPKTGAITVNDEMIPKAVNTSQICPVVVGLLTVELVTQTLAAGGQSAGAASNAGVTRAARLQKERDNLELQKVPPFKAFDNLYYVGVGWVESWLVTTNQGPIQEVQRSSHGFNRARFRRFAAFA